MADETVSRRAKVCRFFRTRGVRFWSVTIAVAAIVVLFVGSQIARDRGQAVDWYTGFGQWLGALASFAAAVAALYISLSDRRHSNEERRQIEERQDADLSRQAGLVRVTAELLGQRQSVGPMNMRPSIGIRNRRADRIFDVEVVKLVHDGEEHELVPAKVNGFSIYPARSDQKHWYIAHQLEGLVLETDEWLVIHQQGSLPNKPADYAAIRYTDRSGRRWEVDTDEFVTRL